MTRTPAPNPDQPVRAVSVVSTGTVDIRPQHVRSTGTPALWWLMTTRRWTGPRPINVYVIERHDGLVLFDTGQDRASVTGPGYFPRSGLTGLIYRRLARFEIAPDQTLTARLAAIGYDIADVHTAVLSHLHTDHIGGLDSDMVLKPGMIIMAEPNPITADGMFGIFLGHTYIITDTGREIVDDFPLEIAVAG